MIVLTVTVPFDIYKAGDIISDPTAISNILASENQTKVVRASYPGIPGNAGIPYYYIDKGIYEIALKPMSMNASPGFGAAGIEWFMKVSAPCDFDEVQVVIYHQDPSTTTVFKAVVAATEDPAQATDDQRWQPMVGGVKHNELNAANGYGFRSVTWDGGAATHTQSVAQTPFVAFNGTTYNIPAITLSDWIPCPSVPSNDGTNNRYALLFLHHIGTTSFAFMDTTLLNAPTALNHGAIMEIGWQANATGTHIDNPTLTALTGPQSVDRANTIGLRFRTRRPAISAMTISDSIAANVYQGLNADGFSSIGYRMAAILTAHGIPCSHVNNGWPGAPMDTFALSAISAINALRPNLVMMNCWSPNGPSTYSTTDLMRQALRLMRAEIQKVMAAANAIGAKVLLSSGIPSSTMTSAVDSLRLEHINILKTQGYFVDENTPISDGATPQRIQSQYQWDAVHPNGAAIELLANIRAEKVKQMFNVTSTNYTI